MINYEYALSSLGAYGHMLGDMFRSLRKSGLEIGETVRQLVKIGVGSIPVVLLTAIFSGMVLALQTAYGLQRFGAKNYVGNVVSLSLVRELGPVLTALMLCGRVGAGIAAEIGSMMVTEQVDALRSLGADPLRKLVAPRVIAAVIAVPVLTVFAMVIGIYGGALIGVYELNITAYTYIKSVTYTLKIKDILDGLIKSCIFGFLIISIACFKGLHTRGGTEGVGRSTTEAVVVGSIIVLISDFFITKALILLG